LINVVRQAGTSGGVAPPAAIDLRGHRAASAFGQHGLRCGRAATHRGAATAAGGGAWRWEPARALDEQLLAYRRPLVAGGRELDRGLVGGPRPRLLALIPGFSPLEATTLAGPLPADTNVWTNFRTTSRPLHGACWSVLEKPTPFSLPAAVSAGTAGGGAIGPAEAASAFSGPERAMQLLPLPHGLVRCAPLLSNRPKVPGQVIVLIEPLCRRAQRLDPASPPRWTVALRRCSPAAARCFAGNSLGRPGCRPRVCRALEGGH